MRHIANPFPPKSLIVMAGHACHAARDSLQSRFRWTGNEPQRRRNQFVLLWCADLALFLAATPAVAQSQTTEAVSFFEKRIRPVLADNCFKCHGAQKATSELRVDSREALTKGGKH